MVGNPNEKPRRQAPTSNGPDAERIFQNETGARLIAKVVRELLNARQFADATQLRQAVEERCAELRLVCTRDQVERALDLVGSNAQLLSANHVAPARPRVLDEPKPLSHAEAKAALDRAGVDVSGGRLGRRQARSRLVAL